MLRLNNDKSACKIHFYCLNRMKLCDESKTKSTRGPTISKKVQAQVQVPNDSSHGVIPIH
eukprot:scaffold38691_cov36-Attheya_sp.AAC.2